MIYVINYLVLIEKKKSFEYQIEFDKRYIEFNICFNKNLFLFLSYYYSYI